MEKGEIPESQFLLATESTARGLDIPHLSHVFILCTVEEVEHTFAS
jgi:superfamily II DNA/RNA helicase